MGLGIPSIKKQAVGNRASFSGTNEFCLRTSNSGLQQEIVLQRKMEANAGRLLNHDLSS